jgi:hypothetical protein
MIKLAIMKRMYRPNEVAQIANVTVSTVYRDLLLGRLPATRIRQKQWWVAENDVRTYAEVTAECMLPEPKRSFPGDNQTEAVRPAESNDGTEPTTE